MNRPCHIIFPLVLSFFASTSSALPPAWSIGEDWSDVNNPTGPWSLRLSNDELLGATLRGNGWSTAQPSWGNFPCWFKSNGTETVSHDWIAGDIITHSGAANDPAHQGVICWVSPMNGSIDISGHVWWGGVPDQFFRANDWFITLNGVNLTGQVGTVGSGSGRGRGNPINFTEGNGGPTALKNVTIHMGDQIRLLIRTNTNSYQGNGAYSGVTFQITPHEGCPADFNEDGVVDFFDYLDFITAFGTPC